MSKCKPEGLPQGWKLATVGEILKVRSGFAFKSADYQDKGVPIIRQSDLREGLVDVSQSKRVSPRFTKELSDYMVRDGDLLIGMSGSLGKIARYHEEEPALQNQRTGLLKLKEGVDSRFAKLVLKLVERQIISEGKGVAVQNVSSKEIESCVFPLPPEKDRAMLVSEVEKQFSRLDEAVAGLKRVKANLKRYKASVLKAAVEGKLTEDWRKAHPNVESGTELLKRILAERKKKWGEKNPGKKYKEPAAPDTSTLPELPKGWTWASFDQVCMRVTVGHVGPMKDEYLESGIPFLRSQNVRENGFNAEGLKFISQEFHKKLEKSSLQPGDLVVVRSGSVGVACVIPMILKEANCSDLVIAKQPHGILPQYGAYYMNSITSTRVAAKRVGIALTHFNTQSMSAMPVPVPPLPEQEKLIEEVDRCLSVAEEIEMAIESNLKRAERLRQGILKSAFSGHLVPQSRKNHHATASTYARL